MKDKESKIKRIWKYKLKDKKYKIKGSKNKLILIWFKLIKINSIKK